jgi:branched-chain amino acid transport system permease protein
MAEWIHVIVQGILLGGLYSLFAAGLSLLFGVMRLVNLAHGDLIVMASFLALAVVEGFGLHPLLSLLIVLPAMFAFGYALQRGIINFALSEDPLVPLLVTFGFSIVLQNVLLQIFSPDSRKLNVGALQTASIGLGPDFAIGLMPLVTLMVAIGVIAGLGVIFYRTSLGRAFRATSDDPDTARLMGIDPNRVFAFAMAIAMAVIGVAGVFMAIRTNFDPFVGPARLLYAFEAVIIGGLGSLWGTLAGGIVLGIAQSIGAKIDPGWQLLTGHLAFLVVLVFRPRGLFPRAVD